MAEREGFEPRFAEHSKILTSKTFDDLWYED